MIKMLKGAARRIADTWREITADDIVRQGEEAQDSGVTR